MIPAAILSRLAPVLVAGAVSVHPWDYLAGNPSFKTCAPGTTVCQSSRYDSNGRTVTYSGGTASYVVYRRDSYGSGVRSDGRCFEGEYPPLFMPLTVGLPTLRAPGTTKLTQGALAIELFGGFDVWGVENCRLNGFQGSIAQSTYLYLLASYDFGGTVGRQQNVMVIEALSGYYQRRDPSKAIRLERYFYVRGLGMLRAEGWEDHNCRYFRQCSGVYSQPVPGGFNMSELSSPGIPIVDICLP